MLALVLSAALAFAAPPIAPKPGVHSSAQRIAPVPARKLDRAGLRLTFSDEFDEISLHPAANDPDPHLTAPFQGAEAPALKEKSEPRRLLPLKGGGREGVSIDERDQTFAWRPYFPYAENPDDLPARTLPGNKERQFYIDPAWKARHPQADAAAFDTIATKEGKLVLRAYRAPEALKPFIHDRKYVSGMISSHHGFSQALGYFEARIKIPPGKGVWPSFWMVAPAAEGPGFFEIDIMESYQGHTPGGVNVGYHDWTAGHQGKARTAPVANIHGFHVYGVEVTTRHIVWYIDDVEVFRTPAPPQARRPYHLYLTLAMEAPWMPKADGATPMPATLEVDWVRVWKRRPDA